MPLGPRVARRLAFILAAGEVDASRAAYCDRDATACSVQGLSREELAESYGAHVRAAGRRRRRGPERIRLVCVLGLGEEDPSQLGPYRLRAVVGDGGMGRVYLGTSPAGRAVAVKVISPGLASQPGYRQRFAREAKAAMAVSGLYTASVVDADTEGPSPYIATEFVPAPSLAESVRAAGPLPAASVFALAGGLAEALAAIHRAGLVHRDVKPHNILLAADGPVVIDFGIALGEGTTLTAAGTAVGTAGYIAPEVLRGHDPTPASDVFSLGCALVYAARGTGPYGDGDPLSVAHRTASQPPDLAGVPGPVRDLVIPLLERDPTLRPTPAQVVRQVSQASGTAVLRDAVWLPDRVRDLLGQRRAEVQRVLGDRGGQVPAPAAPAAPDVPPPAQQFTAAYTQLGSRQPGQPLPPVQAQPEYSPPVPPARDSRRGGPLVAAGAAGALTVIGAVAVAVALARHGSAPPEAQNASSHSAPASSSAASSASADSTGAAASGAVSYRPGTYTEDLRLAEDAFGNTVTLQSIIVNRNGTVEAKIFYTAGIASEWTCAFSTAREATLNTPNGTTDPSTGSDCTRDLTRTLYLMPGQTMSNTEYFAHAPDGTRPWTMTLNQRAFKGSVSGINIPLR